MTVIDRPQNIALPQPVRAFLKKQHKLLIDGKWVDAKSGKTFDVIDPATGEVITKVAAGDAADVELSVAAARRASNASWMR
jgi:phenylacetaldehyde dehydrogenase